MGSFVCEMRNIRSLLILHVKSIELSSLTNFYTQIHMANTTKFFNQITFVQILGFNLFEE